MRFIYATIKRLIEDYIALFFPNCCLLCAQVLVRGEEHVCLTCWQTLPLTNHHQQPDNAVLQKFYGLIPVKHAMALYRFTKGSKVQQLLHQLKYNNKPELGDLFGRWYGEILYTEGYKGVFDLIIPVPLHELRQKARGYNQSDWFAQGLSKGLHVPCNGKVVKRIISTVSQTQKGGLERWKNLHNVFQVIATDMVQGKKILLVDDLITTGATLVACANALLQAGCKEISVATIAATEYK